MRILALVPGGISEQLLFFPTLSDIKQQYPSAAIDVMVEPRAKAAYRVCQNIHEVLLFDYKDRNGLADYLNLLGIIRDREYDVALGPKQTWTVDMLLWLNGIPMRIGYKTSSSLFQTNPVPLKSEQYAAYMYHDLVQGMGIHTPCPELKINVPKPDIDWTEAEQKRLDLQESGYILINHNSSPTYPPAQWQQIIQDIQQKQPDLNIVFIQDSENEQLVGKMKRTCPEVKVIMPPDLGKLAATIAGANLILTTDSAAMHLSVAVGTYTIALFGATDGKKLLPPDSDRYIAIQSTTSKIEDIKPETILEQIWRS